MQDFISYLLNLQISKKSLKNYKSDVNHFTSWMIMKVRTFGSFVENLDQAIPFLSTTTASEYKNYLSENKIPNKTINRRLSTLRHLAKFLHNKNITDFNFMEGIENRKYQTSKKEVSMQPIVDQFKAYLISEKVSASTVKNYVSDVRQFVNWLEKNPTYVQTT